MPRPTSWPRPGRRSGSPDGGGRGTRRPARMGESGFRAILGGRHDRPRDVPRSPLRPAPPGRRARCRCVPTGRWRCLAHVGGHDGGRPKRATGTDRGTGTVRRRHHGRGASPERDPRTGTHRQPDGHTVPRGRPARPEAVRDEPLSQGRLRCPVHVRVVRRCEPADGPQHGHRRHPAESRGPGAPVGDGPRYKLQPVRRGESARLDRDPQRPRGRAVRAGLAADATRRR